jgi:hypothetical protein
MLYLVDTSAWILHFARGSGFDLRLVCQPDDRVLCLPVFQEILQGIRNEAASRSIRSILEAALFVENPLSQTVFLEAADLYRTSRRRGRTIRSSVDCLIAACAIRSDLTVLHRDRDYPILAEVSPLKERGV